MPATTAEFLRQRRADILLAWERAVRTGSTEGKVDGPALRDYAPHLIEELARWVEQEDPGAARPGAAAGHFASERLRGAYDLPRLIGELRLLGETILRLLLEGGNVEEQRTGESSTAARALELARLSSALDMAIAVIAEQFVAQRDWADATFSDARFRWVVENSRDGINLLDLSSGRYILLSPAQVAMTGFTEAELRELPAEDAIARIHPDDRHVSLEQQRAIAAGLEGGSSVEYRWKVKSGEYRWFSDSRSVVRDEQGHPVALVGISRDITDRKRAEEALRLTEERYRTLFDSIDEGFCIVEVLFDGERAVDYRFLEVNPAFEHQTGIERAVGRRMRDIAPRHEQHWFDVYGRVARTGEAARFQLGAEALGRFYDVYAFRVGIPEDRRVAILFRDITARHRAEQALRASEERLRALVTATSDVVYRMSADWRELWHLRGRDFIADAQAPTRTWLEKYIPPDDRARVTAAIAEAIRTKSVLELEHRVVRVDGSLGWTFSRAIPLLGEDGAIVEWFGTASDVTKRKLAEEALRDADQRKTEFLAVLSHELRNPLAPIRNSIHLLERAAQGSEQAARARQVLRRQTEHLTRLVDDLLDVTRVSQGKITLQRTELDLDQVVRTTVDDLRSLFEESGVELSVEHPPCPVWIDGDPTRIAQVVSNVLQNAVKFTPPRGTVAVRVAAAEGAATLSVKDTGVGMDPAAIDYMFEPFAQGAQGLARGKGGLGLGLALVKKLVEQHGGSVTARSDGPGHGSEFVVALPHVARTAAPVESAAVHAAAGRLVLVVEDNADAGQTLADVLELSGHRVRVALDGRSGLALARELQPDVILCDIGLPDMDGYELARAVRREAALARTRLVALTGYAQPEDRDRARDAGFDSHVAKPLSPEDLGRLLSG